MTSTPDPQETGGRGADETPESQGAKFTFHDKRRFDPESGEARQAGGQAPDGAAQAAPSAEAAGPAAASAAEAAQPDPIDAEAAALVAEDREQLEARIAELEDQVKRDQAEYVNSRRRIENTAEQRVVGAKASVLTSLISVLDDVDLARRHGELEEGTPFHSIAVKLEETVSKQGMVRFGEAGEVFDPSEHEALFHEESADVDQTVIKAVLQPGYKMDETILRPARVQTQGPA